MPVRIPRAKYRNLKVYNKQWVYWTSRKYKIQKLCYCDIINELRTEQNDTNDITRTRHRETQRTQRITYET